VLAKMTNAGWKIVKSHSHPDGTFTYVLELWYENGYSNCTIE
jgi:hypothetical protein